MWVYQLHASWFKSMLKGLNKLILNEEAIAADLETNWAVVAEAIQTVFKKRRILKTLRSFKRFNKNKRSYQ